MLDIQPSHAHAAHGVVHAHAHVLATSAVTPLFRNRSFLRLWFVAAATQVGGHMALYAMTILVFSTTRSNTAVSALLMTYMLPQVLLSSFAGVIIDRVDLRWAMIAPNAVRAALMVGLAMAGVGVPLLLLLNVGISFTSVVLMPAEGSMVPRVVPPDHLETALGIFNLTFQASFAVGFAVAGPLLVVVFGPSVVLGIVAAFYVAATVVCIGLPPAPPEVRRSDSPGRSDAIQPIRELRDGFRAIRGNADIERPIIVQAAAAAVAGVLGVLGPALALTIGLEPSHFAAVVLPLGLGVVVGILGLRRLRRSSHRRTAEFGLMAFGALAFSLALMAAVGSVLGQFAASVLPFVMGVAFAAGAAYGITAVSAQTALLEAMPSDARGRVFGVLASIVSAVALLTSVVAGPVADHVSAPVVVAVVGLAVAAVAAWLGRPSGLRTTVSESTSARPVIVAAPSPPPVAESA
jgi:predicted MFS family arabinose efflux permease